ncbi:MAG: glycosyltransferase family 2 protein [Candidatus Obscuribacterales bacterium]|nr:glycosyltransferase family 2 protein [Candidatus Obscuribacterales bacterium]
MALQSHKISVIIPAHNAEKHIEQALLSVANQSYAPHEIIVVDDGSTDGTAELVNNLSDVATVLLSQPNSGAAAARNFGIKQATCPLIAFLDADDLWVQSKLALQVDAMKDAQLDAVFGHVVEFVDGTDAAEGKPIPGLSPITMLARRELFSTVGEFSTEWCLGEFIDWWARAKEHNVKELMLDTVVAKRRIHAENQGVVKQSSRQDYAKIIAAAIQRRRRQSDSCQ